MKEIDFIPEWYRTGRKRMVGYHRQYVLIAFLFVALLAWSHAAGSFVSRAKAGVDQTQGLLKIEEPLSQAYNEIKAGVADLQTNAGVLERVRPRVDVSCVIAELSHLISGRIVLGRIDVSSEALQFAPTAEKKHVVTIAAQSNQTSSALPQKSIRSKVAITGIAAEASDVASLISKLEESSWFCRIIPGYSRSKKIKDVAVTEFEIGCYVANYVQDTGAGPK
ncbi:MAG: hypothetical protein DRP66_11350 [Planctomycetota bacterium]|nr:MAG: hypothetical protein DRP66_11350 [Planctomycetota bacterium]